MSWLPMSTVEGQPLIGGRGRFRSLARAEGGVALRGTLDGREVVLGVGETIVHPRGVPHRVKAIVDSRWVEFKTPLPGRPPIGG